MTNYCPSNNYGRFHVQFRPLNCHSAIRNFTLTQEPVKVSSTIRKIFKSDIKTTKGRFKIAFVKQTYQIKPPLFNTFLIFINTLYMIILM